MKKMAQDKLYSDTLYHELIKFAVRPEIMKLLLIQAKASWIRNYWKYC